MNPEHYNRIKVILLKSQALMDESMRKSGAKRDADGRWHTIPPEAFKALIPACRQLWQKDFPEQQAQDELPQLDLSGADLSGHLIVSFRYCGNPFDGANLRGAKLDGTRWFMGWMHNADLTGASLRDAQLDFVFCNGSVFRNADLSGAYLMLIGSKDPAIDFTDANFTDAKIRIFASPPPLVLKGANMDNCLIHTLTKTVEERVSGRKNLDAFVSNLSEGQQSTVKVQEVNRELKEIFK